jgi:Arc/MetJ-type ribon-helix-helix transcriptional regulator
LPDSETHLLLSKQEVPLVVAQMTVPKDIADSVNDLVSSGAFPDTDAVLREAMQLLRDQQEEQRFLDSIEQARRDHAEGRSRQWNEEYIAEIWERAQKLAGTGVVVDPDVWPE